MEPNYTYKATITNVVDGDTVDAVVDLGFHLSAKLRLRLLGVDTPELRSKVEEERDAAQLAKQFVINKVLNKDVMIQTKKADAFGRYLADVFYTEDGNILSLSTVLLQEGLAEVYK